MTCSLFLTKISDSLGKVIKKMNTFYLTVLIVTSSSTTEK